MYLSYQDIRGYSITAEADSVGTLADLYVDSASWQSAFLVLEAGRLLSSNRLLLRADQVTDADPGQRSLHTTLSRQAIESAPPASSMQTVSDRQEPDWRIAAGHGVMLVNLPGVVMPSAMLEQAASAEDASEVPLAERHLRSADELRGYAVAGADKSIGIVHDLIIDPADWSVPWLSIDTGRWLPGELVVLKPHWATGVSWDERSVRFDLTAEQIENSPPLTSLERLERSAEEALHAWYSLPMI